MSQDSPVVVGAGIAGLLTALLLSPRPCVLLSGAPLGSGTSTGWAQGGIAAALGADDAPALHAADTLGAGDGLCDPAIVRLVTEAAGAAVADLERFGVRFDRTAGNHFATGLEAAHSRARILHAGGGDRAGARILAALVEAARATPSITIHEGTVAERVLLDGAGGVAGLLVSQGGVGRVLPSAAVVLATGGIGGLYGGTTNPISSIGDGIALAAEAGAVLRDLEFVQFHPTAIDIGEAAGSGPLPLATEALRGAGAVLVDRAGASLTAGLPGGDLAPRDAVARAVFAARAAGRGACLDATGALGDAFAGRFPQVHALCRAHGIDPARQPIPIRPAAHYHMGGVATDADGRTSVPGLWALGEVAATGLHGANRLASNSLLEGAVFARRVAADLLGRAAAARPPSGPHAGGTNIPPVRPLAPPRIVRRIMDAEVGVLRDGAGLARASAQLARLVDTERGALVARLVAHAALLREETRGAHARRDRPAMVEPVRPSRLTLSDLPDDAGRRAA